MASVVDEHETESARPSQTTRQIKETEKDKTSVGTDQFVIAGIKGIDAKLVHVMTLIEIKVRKALEKYAELKEIHGHDKKFMRKL